MLVAPDHTLVKTCQSPVKIPERELKSQEIESLWTTDRVNLSGCRDSKQALVDFYKFRDAELTK